MFHETYNKGVAACIDIAKHQAHLTRQMVSTAGLKGTTPESKEYLVRADEEINTLTALVQSLERLKI